MPVSPARKWAQQRNFAKRRLSASKATLSALRSGPILTIQEKSKLKEAQRLITEVINSYSTFNSRSKAIYTKGK